MTKQPRTIPNFRSEEEELRFWDEHDPSDFVEGPADIIVRLKRRPKRAVTLRMDQGLYDRLRATAEKHGVPYQRLMRELLRQSLNTLAAQERRASLARRHPKTREKVSDTISDA
jgi:predicted DNA binding CopG/RHH family protein